MTARPGGTLTYVYCVVHSPSRVSAPRLRPRLPSASTPRVIPLGGALWMVVSCVDANLYSEEALVQGLQDLTWVSRCAVGHEAIVQACLPKGTVVPMKLLTLFASDGRASVEIGARRAEILETVRHIGGALEWGVRLVSGEPAARPAEVRFPRTGRAYLEAKRRSAAGAGDRLGRAENLGERIVKTLSRVATDMRRRESIEQVPASRVLLDVAYLVPRRATTTFQRRVRSLGAQAGKAGYEVILTGPWPAYHFVSQDSVGTPVTASPGLAGRTRESRRRTAAAPSTARTPARRRASVRR